MSAPLILPVGRYTGEFHPSVGAPARYHSLSVGRLSVTVEDPQAFAVWAAAHRPVDLPDQPWTRAAVVDAARGLGVAAPDRIVAEFLADGLLVEVIPDTDDAVDFARAHRVLPLMVSLGNTPDDPLRYGIGLFGTEPVLRVPALVHDVWQWGSTGDDLWQVCLAYADAGARAEVADAREHDPRFVLGEVLTALPMLLGVDAACLDEARRS
ncbi:hypothetical protein GA0070616_2320 [Micromonospora nigra]|uniref:Uncharacterized protein n=1 Tax=Micromonospora nigra TaxID=145857 RepID=A0A1C6RWC2_9ACTN|nr:hypothetical protein [Micromonospora nigra]SCL21507.1 hypothetical protein GA0070616_2320 [Micromonospora nigra]